MKKAETNIGLRIIVWGATLVALLAFWLHLDTLLFTTLPDKVQHYEQKISEKLAAQGLAAYWDFEDLRVVDLLSDETAQAVQGVEVIQGRYGLGRRLLFTDQGSIETKVPWQRLGSTFSLSCWIDIRNRDVNFNVLRYLEWRKGRLLFHVPSRGETLKATPPSSGMFHVAAVVDNQAGVAQLYINGALQDSQPFKGIYHRPGAIQFGQTHWNPPPALDLDEVACWGRALTSDEVRELHLLEESLAESVCGSNLKKLGVTTAYLRALHDLCLVTDEFNPRHHAQHLSRTPLRKINLALSKKDRRVLNAYHHRRARHGITAWGTSAKRKGAMVVGNEAQAVAVELMGSPVMTKRPIFSIELDEPLTSGMSRCVLTPIEVTDALLVLLADALADETQYPAEKTELCLLSINNSIDGLYLCQDDSDSHRPFRWAPEPADPGILIRKMPFFREELLHRFDQLAREYLPMFVSDQKNGISRRQVGDRIAQQRKKLEALLTDHTGHTDDLAVERVLAFLKESRLLNGNPAADYLTTDLDLTPRVINGVEVTFESQSPEHISDNGRISRPESTPAKVEIVVTAKAGEITNSKSLHFRVAPTADQLPALRFHVWNKIDPDNRIPCDTRLLDPATGDRARAIPARIRQRGNEALAAKKKYYSVKMYGEHDYLGLGSSRYLKLTSAYRDATFMREKLTYDLFRSFSTADKPRYAVQSHYVNLFLNNRYEGIYTVSERVDATALGFDLEQHTQPVMYKAAGRSANFKTFVRSAYVQKEPSWATGEHWGPLEELIGTIADTASDSFEKIIEETVDVDNVIDFHILINLVSSEAGLTHNLYLARGPHRDDPFFFVPWDYDEAYGVEEWISSHLTDRLADCSPSYRSRLKARWDELRKKQLSDASIMKRIGQMDAELASGLAHNFERWPLPEGQSHEQAVNDLRSWISKRLTDMDAWIDSI